MLIQQPLLPSLDTQLTRAAPTFAEVLLLVPTWEDLAETRRRDLASGLRRAAKILGLPPGAVSTEPAWLNQHLFQRTAAAHGLSEASFRNLVSLVRAALRRIGCHAEKAQAAPVVTDGWAQVLESVPATGQRACLARFARHAGARGVAPEQMTDAVLAEYVAEHLRTHIAANRQDFARTVAQAWNAVRRSLPALALPALQVGKRRLRYALRLAVFPESFQADVERFRQRLGQGGSTGRFLLSDKGPQRKLAARTIETRIFCIRQAAGILVLLGHEPSSITSLNHLIEPLDRPSAILDWLHNRRVEREGGDRNQQGGQVAAVAETLRQIACHHIGASAETIAAISGWSKSVQKSRRSGMTPENRQRLREITQPRPYALLLNLPEELMRRAQALQANPKEAARLAMMAVVLEVLLVFPIRKGSLAGLRLDRHLQRLGPKGRATTHIILAEQDTKNREPLEWPLPAESGRLIDEYIQRFRPTLAEPANPFLFPSQDGRGMRSADTLASALVQIVEKETGCRIHLHLLRHLAAWTYLKHNPGAYEDVRRILGHRDIATTIAFYVGFEAAAAAERFDTVVLRERKATRVMARAAWGTRPLVAKRPGKER